MQPQSTRYFPELDPRSGVLVLDGFGIKLFVRRGHLVLVDGVGDESRERCLTRSRRDVGRIVILGHAGFITLEALRWLDAVGVALVQLGLDGRPMLTSSLRGRDHAGIRRAQARLLDVEASLVLAHGLLSAKLSNQATLLRDLKMPRASVEEVERRVAEARAAGSLSGILAAEAAGAKSYWDALASVQILFPRADLKLVPEHWLSFGGRRSSVTGRNRQAANPANAMLNFLYRLAESETTRLLATVGLDPGVGVWHADAANRDSLSLDVLEPIRPQIDRYVFEMMARRPLSRKLFHETAQGVCRVRPPLSHELVESTPLLASWAAPWVEKVASLIGESGDPPVMVGTVLTGDNMSEIKRRIRGRTRTTPQLRPRVRPRVCRMCGVAVGDARRVICDGCLPEYDVERTASLTAAGKRTLATMRASSDDPAKSPEARQKLVERSRQATLADRAWEREHGRDFDVVRYTSTVLPVVQGMSTSTLVHFTGLSAHYLWRVKKGERRLHPRHWEGVFDEASRRGQR